MQSNELDSVKRTVARMYEYIRKDSNALPDFHSIADAFDFIRSVPYVTDIASTGRDEFVKRASVTLRDGGDCDDKVILSGVALNRLGVPFRIVTTSYLPTREPQHTYLEILQGSRWLPFDATYSNNKLFVAIPYTDKIIWEEHLKPLVKNPRPLSGTQDEGEKGGGSGNIAIDIINSIGGGIGTFISSLFRTATKKGDIAQGQKQWYEGFSPKLITLWKTLPMTAKVKLNALAKAYLEHELRAYGNWWGDYGNKEYTRVKSLPEFQDIYYQTDWYLFFPTYMWFTQEDLTRLPAAMNERATVLNNLVWTPFSTWMKANVSITPDSSGGTNNTGIPESGTTPGTESTPLQSGFGLVAGLALLGAAGYAFLNSKSKRRK